MFPIAGQYGRILVSWYLYESVLPRAAADQARICHPNGSLGSHLIDHGP